MPISINLLAEQQAQEEDRRRDPVKRAVLAAVILVVVMLTGFGYLRIRVWATRSETAVYENRFKGLEVRHAQAQTNDAQLFNVRGRLEKLNELAAARVLWGNALDAMQSAVQPEVQLHEFKVSQEYKVEEATKGRTNSSGVVTPGRPARAREKVVVLLSGRDYGRRPAVRPGDSIPRYQELVQSQPFFKTNAHAIRMTGRSLEQVLPEAPNEPFVEFKLEGAFEEKER